MGDNLFNAMAISANGMRAQGERIRVITENVANADTAANVPGEEPYRRQLITFKNQMDRDAGVRKVEVDSIDRDMKSPFPEKFMPDHPGADERGYVRMPNVNTLIEVMDIREAQRSYEANLGMIQRSQEMVNRTIDLLRGQ